MKKIILVLLSLVSFNYGALSHALWLEANPQGQVGQPHEVKVYFGEFSAGVLESVSGDSFEFVKRFKVWVIDPKGRKSTIKVTPSENFYLASFTPKQRGTYTILLNNDEIEVMDYSEYNYGIFKTHYHSVAKVVVGEVNSQTISSNQNGITLVDLSTSKPTMNGEVNLQVIYKGTPLADTEVTVFVADGWAKTLTTDEKGKIALQLPWAVQYFVEVSKKEEVPGKYKGTPYEFVYHCATYSIDLSI